GDWTDQRSDHFTTWPTLGAKKPAPGQITVFRVLSAGLQTNRDAWVYNSSRTELTRNVQRLITNYNAQLPAFEQYRPAQGIVKANEKDVTAYLSQTPEAADQRNIKWSASLNQHLARRRRADHDPEGYRTCLYRPFQAQHVYFGPMLSHRRGELDSIFPTPHHDNIGIYQVGDGSAVPFSVVMTDRLPDLHVTGAGSGGQFFP